MWLLNRPLLNAKKDSSVGNTLDSTKAGKSSLPDPQATSCSSFYRTYMQSLMLSTRTQLPLSSKMARVTSAVKLSLKPIVPVRPGGLCHMALEFSESEWSQIRTPLSNPGGLKTQPQHSQTLWLSSLTLCDSIPTCMKWNTRTSRSWELTPGPGIQHLLLLPQAPACAWCENTLAHPQACTCTHTHHNKNEFKKEFYFVV